MKNIIYICLVGMLVFFASCADETKKPIITFDQADKGAYPRLLNLIQGEYDLQNIGGSNFVYEVEFVDLDQGNLVGEYKILVTYRDNNPSNGDNSTAQQLFKSVNASEFKTNDRGFKGLDVSLSLTEVAAAIGVNTADIMAGDVFAYATSVVLSEGKEFTSANSTSAVRGSAFQGFFDFNANATCPLPDAMFSGTYALSYDDLSGDAWGESLREANVTLELISGSTTQRKFDAIFLDIFGSFDVTITIDFVCDKVQFFDNDTGVGCGDNILLLGSAGSEDLSQPVDINDDSVIILKYAELGGDCGYDAVRTMRLTKQ